jgi:hypothetical protein
MYPKGTSRIIDIHITRQHFSATKGITLDASNALEVRVNHEGILRDL